ELVERSYQGRVVLTQSGEFHILVRDGLLQRDDLRTQTGFRIKPRRRDRPSCQNRPSTRQFFGLADLER
ncbi:hypothetical protein AB0C13_41260, partial [Streptomyces sp. NPDC049099]|uniref:hypothetical protein n=1 Tax=Streptomyces sp. NPDC049099 TaxID=3155768 RepID=UPI00344220BE